jgi:hypothetical protein
MVLLVLTLAGCTGDRTKQSMLPSEETQPRIAFCSIASIVGTAA